MPFSNSNHVIKLGEKLKLNFLIVSSLAAVLFVLASTQPARLAAQTTAIAQTSPTQTSTTAPTTTPDLDLTIFPPTAYLIVKPGTNITHRVLLKYEGQVRVRVLPELVDFKTDGLTGAPILQKPSQLSYIELQNPDKQLGEPFTIEPGTQVELIINVNPPLHAKLGEYPLSLVLTAFPETQVVFDGSSAQASGGVASNVLLSVQPDFDNQGELQIDKLNLPKFVDSFGSINFSTLVKNVGRNAVAAQGQIRLNHAWSGKELKQWHIYPDVVLANNTRLLRVLLQNPAEIATDEEITFADLSYKPPFLIGPYEVTIDLSNANPNNQDLHQRSQTVFAFPFSVIGLIIIGITIYFTINKIEQKKRN